LESGGRHQSECPADFTGIRRSGRVAADSRVARGLFGRAVGYDRTVERMAIVAGELKPVTSTIHYPANVQACIFWLRNRRRQTWRDTPNEPPSSTVDDLALLEAAGESVRHHDGD
jgi:hypothetical protein